MRYKIENEGDGFYTIREVPIFKTHDDRGFPCNEEWMSDAIQNFRLYKDRDDYRPHIIVGHQKKDQYEKESVGFLDNLILKGKMLYADLVRIPKRIKERIVMNEYPNRSVEILPKSRRVLALALLGGTTPHFALPQMVYGHREQDEYSLLFRSPDMAFSKDERKEIFSMIKDGLKESLPEVLEQFGQDGNEAPEVYDMPSAQASSILNSGELPEFFQAEDGAFYSEGDDGNYYRWPTWTHEALMKFAQAEGPAKFEAPSQGYAINPETLEVYQDGVKIGVVNPTVPVDVDALPPIPANKDAVTEPQPQKVAAGTEGAGNVEGEGTPPANPNIIPQEREESDQFSSVEEKEIYDLKQKVDRMETANQLLQAGRRAEEFTSYLREQKAAGTPIANIEEIVDYLMTQTTEQVEQFKKMLENQPKLALGKIDTGESPVTFSETEVKVDYEKNREFYDAMGVDEKDLKWAPFVRTGPGSMAKAS